MIRLSRGLCTLCTSDAWPGVDSESVQGCSFNSLSWTRIQSVYSSINNNVFSLSFRQNVDWATNIPSNMNIHTLKKIKQRKIRSTSWTGCLEATSNRFMTSSMRIESFNLWAIFPDVLPSLGHLLKLNQPSLGRSSTLARWANAHWPRGARWFGIGVQVTIVIIYNYIYIYR